jgi:endonuclease/exonuclease/phosphatase family metal-dependent hydrolase
VTMTEVITNANGEQANTIATLLQQRTGVTWYVHFANEEPARAFVSNVILTKWPIVSKSTKFLDTWGSAAQATINIQGKPVNVFATHLWWQSGDTQKRLFQISNLKPWAATFAEPRVIAGDFNYQPGTPEYNEMVLTYSDAWNVARLAGLATSYPNNPVGLNTRTRRTRLDHAYFSGPSMSVVGASIPDTRDLNNTNVQILLNTLDDRGVRPSDHNMLVTTYEVR